MSSRREKNLRIGDLQVLGFYPYRRAVVDWFLQQDRRSVWADFECQLKNNGISENHFVLEVRNTHKADGKIFYLWFTDDDVFIGLTVVEKIW